MARDDKPRLGEVDGPVIDGSSDLGLNADDPKELKQKNILKVGPDEIMMNNTLSQDALEPQDWLMPGKGGNESFAFRFELDNLGLQEALRRILASLPLVPTGRFMNENFRLGSPESKLINLNNLSLDKNLPPDPYRKNPID